MYQAEFQQGSMVLFRQGQKWFSLPASVSINDQVLCPSSQGVMEENICVFRSENMEMRFTLLPDSIEVDFFVRMAEDTPLRDAVYFRNSAGGMDIGHFDRAFCPQPRRNQGHNLDYHMNLPDCSLTGYFSPSILNFVIGNKQGLAAFGLLDLPDSSRYKLLDDFSILVEACGGNKIVKAGETYRMPKLLITFPDDEWQSIPLFRQKLLDYGRYVSRKPASIPEWWKDPIICTYGDELATLNIPDVEMNGPQFNADFVRRIVDVAEKEWGIRHMNLVLDAFWQVQFALEPVADEARFGDMRAFVDEMHARGHHVWAWITPMFDSVANGFEPRSEKLGVLSSRTLAPLGVEGCVSIDMTADNAALYYQETAKKLFGSGEGQYNFDGVKLDYMALQRDPAIHGPYAHPEKGLGVKELKLFYEMFYAAAKAVKPEAIINSSATDPRFEHLLDFNRLHDTHAGNAEKECRARVSTLACPDLLIDSDGALMYTTWAKRHYLCAAVYATPSNYYTLQYEDRALSAADKQALGTLLQLAHKRPAGRAEMESFGNWRLVDADGTVNARTIGGHTLIFYPTKDSETGCLFTWQDEAVILPLEGRHFGQLTAQSAVAEEAPLTAGSALLPKGEGCRPDYARDEVTLRLKPGVLYTFRDVDEGNGLDRLFSRRAANMEHEVQYANH